MEYGYARVSTREQNEERQLIALREFGLNDGQIILDKQSGKDFDRRGYRRVRLSSCWICRCSTRAGAAT